MPSSGCSAQLMTCTSTYQMSFDVSSTASRLISFFFWGRRGGGGGEEPLSRSSIKDFRPHISRSLIATSEKDYLAIHVPFLFFKKALIISEKSRCAKTGKALLLHDRFIRICEKRHRKAKRCVSFEPFSPAYFCEAHRVEKRVGKI